MKKKPTVHHEPTALAVGGSTATEETLRSQRAEAHCSL